MKVSLITEGGTQFGWGHLIRCFAIYEAFVEFSIQTTFIVNGRPISGTPLDGVPCTHLDWVQQPKQLLTQLQDTTIAFVDSYEAPATLYQDIADRVPLLVSIDDTNRLRYPKDSIILNYAGYTATSPAPQTNCEQLQGLRYAPLTKSFWTDIDKVAAPTIQKILVIMGGIDIRNLTPKIYSCLSDLFPDAEKIIILAKPPAEFRINESRCKLIVAPTRTTLRNLMIDADVAISAGGHTLCELMATRTPTVGIAVADNQLPDLHYLSQEGLVRSMGTWQDKNWLSRLTDAMLELRNSDTRQRMIAKQTSAMDGRGALRIVKELLSRGDNQR